MKKFLIRKKHFVFGPKGSAYLILNKVHSNIFITLTDYNNKVIICKTSGMCDVGTTKKKKTAPNAVENIVKGLALFFKTYDIRVVDIIIRFKITNHMLILVKELLALGVAIRYFLLRMRLSHNGLRGRKIRRV
jgi:ribosomal protein S11